MVRVYKVRLYDGVFKEGNKDYDLVGSILVKRTPMGYVDVLTGFKLTKCTLITGKDWEEMVEA